MHDDVNNTAQILGYLPIRTGRIVDSDRVLFMLEDDDLFVLVSFNNDVAPTTYDHLDNDDGELLSSVGMHDAAISN